MAVLKTRLIPLLFGGRSYINKVKGIAPANLLAYWPLRETSGAQAADVSGNGRHGTYTGVDLANAAGPDGRFVPFFDGANDFVNIYSASLASVFDGNEGTFAVWGKVNAAAVWTDGAERYLVHLASADNAQRIYIAKPTNNNQINFVRVVTTIKTVGVTGQTSVDWIHLALTWSRAADEMKAYLNGEQVGTTQTGLNEWTASLGSTRTLIGARLTTPLNVWHGWGSHAAMWNTPLLAAQVQSLFF